MPWEEGPDYIRSGHRDPDEFEPNSLRTITLSEEEGIKAVIGKPRGKDTTDVQSYLFDKEKWTLEKAKAWFQQHEAKAKESFSWAGSIKELPGVGNLIRGKALHPIKTYHLEEWPEVRVYLEEELQKSAHSLAGKPLILDHYRPLKGKVLGAEYEDGAIEYFAELDDQEVLNKIRDGKIKHCSVEFEWQRLERVDGVAPLGINFTGLSLLEHFAPGDPLSTVEEVWEAIIRQLKEAKSLAPPNPMRGSETEGSKMSEQAVGPTQGPSLEDRVKLVEDTIGVLSAKIEKLLALVPHIESKASVEAVIKKVLAEQEDERERLRQAQRERAQKYGITPKEGGHLTKPSEYEDVPEDQFADPVNYRYPITKEYVRGALTYFNQPKNREAGGYTHEEAVKIMERIIKAALANDIEVSYQSDDPVYRDLPEELKSKLAGYEAKQSEGVVKEQRSLVEAVVQPEPIEPTIPVKEVISMIEAVIPPKVAERSWTFGAQRFCQEVRGVVHQLKGRLEEQ